MSHCATNNTSDYISIQILTRLTLMKYKVVCVCASMRIVTMETNWLLLVCCTNCNIKIVSIHIFDIKTEQARQYTPV